MYRKLTSLIILSAFLSSVVGCTSMRYISREEISWAEQRSSVWVTMSNGIQYEIKQPKVQGSKLVGYVEGKYYKEIDFSRIESIGVKELDQRKTTVLCALGVTGAIFLFSVLSDDESESCYT